MPPQTLATAGGGKYGGGISARAAGTMTVTQYTLGQAENFWEAKLPAVRRFGEIVRALITDVELQREFFLAEDRALWYEMVVVEALQ